MLNGLNLVEVSQCSLCILAFSLVFTLYLSNTQSFQQNRHIIFHTLVALKLLVDRQIDRQTDRRTDGWTHRPTTVTLAAHARRGLTTLPQKVFPILLQSPYTKSANAGTFTCTCTCRFKIPFHVHVYNYVHVAQNYAPALTYMYMYMYICIVSMEGVQ